MADRPYPKVLYIGGTGRTGSTLLTRLLGEVPGWFAGGELAFFWRHGLGSGGRCSCDQPVASCPLWAAVLADMEAAGVVVDADRMVALRRRCWSVHLPLMVHRGVADRLLDRLEEFPATVEAFYRSIAAVSGSRVIVDSSKEPHYSRILRDRTGLDVHFLHLVRDPRAVAHSWRRPRRERGLGVDARMEQRGPLRAAVYYDVSDVAAEAIWAGQADRYRLLRYEDFVEDPRAALRAIAEFVDEPLTHDPLGADGTRFRASEQHIAWGNPNRFDAGELVIRADEAWRDEMGRAAASVMAAATAPVARRYGYPLVPSRRRRPVRVPTLRRSQIMGDEG